MTAVQLIRSMLENNRKFTLALADGLESKALLYQGPGGRLNHALWLLAHIANSETNLARWAGATIDAKPLAPPDTIGRGSTPSADASRYPSKAEILAYMERVRGRVLATLDRTSEADLDKPSVGQNVPPAFRTRGDAWRVMASHEMMHAAQLTVIRKELGLPPALG